MKIALFPGSFDPVTKAHVDIIKRSMGLFDKIYIGIGDNSSKKGLLTVSQREQMLRAVFENEPKIHVVAYDGLTVEFCRSIGATYMIRGIRTVSDFEYEKAIADANRTLDASIETVFVKVSLPLQAPSEVVINDTL